MTSGKKLLYQKLFNYYKKCYHQTLKPGIIQEKVNIIWNDIKNKYANSDEDFVKFINLEIDNLVQLLAQKSISNHSFFVKVKKFSVFI